MKPLVVVNGVETKGGRKVTALTLTLTFVTGMVSPAMMMVK